MKIYLRKLDIDPHSNEFIFRSLVKTKSSYKLTQKNKPISYTTFRDQLAKSLKNVVPDPSVYGTHSFRSGGASRAANSRVNDRLFQCCSQEWLHQGRHLFMAFSLEVFGALVRFSLLIRPYTFSSRLWYNVLLLLLVLGLNCQNKPNGFSSCCVLRGGAEIGSACGSKYCQGHRNDIPLTVR